MRWLGHAIYVQCQGPIRILHIKRHPEKKPLLLNMNCRRYKCRPFAYFASLSWRGAFSFPLSLTPTSGQVQDDLARWFSASSQRFRLLNISWQQQHVSTSTVQSSQKRSENLAKQDPGRQGLADQVSKSRNKFLATTYQPFLVPLYSAAYVNV